MRRKKNKNFQGVEQCNKCGLCQSACPVYQTIRLESYSPRGKIRLTREIGNEEIEISDRVKNIFEKCLLCGSCYDICPAGVHGSQLFSGIRWEIAKRYGIDLKKKLLYLLLSQPWRLKASSWMAKWAQDIFGPILPQIKVGNIPLNQIPRFNKNSFNTQISNVTPALGRTRAKVLYFHGCATNFLFERIGFAVINVLTRMGVEVHTPRNQGCCGLPIFLSGARQMSLQSIKAVIEKFAKKDFLAIIVDCATCGSTFKREYPVLLQQMSKESASVSPALVSGAKQIAEKTADIMEFITGHEAWLPPMIEPDKKVKVTYHAPCHLTKGQGIKKAPRQMLQKLPGIELVPLDQEETCCGGGGSFQVDHPEISNKITEKKLKSIQETGAEILVTGCPSCLLTIGGNLDPAAGIRLMHPVELIKQVLENR